MKKLILLILPFYLGLMACQHETIAIDDKIESFSYPTNSMQLVVGNGDSSDAPVFTSKSEASFVIQVLPSNSSISIDKNGVIHVDSNSPIGYYEVTVSVTNATGSTVFSNAYNVRVTSSIISFDLDVLPLIRKSCGPCHVEGGENIDYTVYATSKALISLTLERIKMPASNPLVMPPTDSGILTQAEIDLYVKWNSDGLKP